MKVMEIVSGVDVNGAIMHALLLTKEMARCGHTVIMVCRRGSWIGRELAGTANVIVHECNLNRWPLNELNEVARMIRVHQIEIIHTHMTRAHNFGVFLSHLTHVPCVATAQSHKMHPHWQFASHIIAVSGVTRRYHQTHNLIPRRKMDMVYNFVDSSRFNLPQDTREEVRSELNLSPEQRLVGVISDFLPRKGQLYLVRALPEILKSAPDTMVAFAGHVRKPDYYDRVRHEAEKLGVVNHILWLGYRSDIPRLLSALDVYVLPSLDEMFPVAVLEAMAAGCACVASAVGGTPECNAEPGSLVLVPPADPQALTRAIVDMLADEEHRSMLREAAKNTIQNHFTVERLTPAILDVLARVARSGRRHLREGA